MLDQVKQFSQGQRKSRMGLGLETWGWGGGGRCQDHHQNRKEKLEDGNGV